MIVITENDATASETKKYHGIIKNSKRKKYKNVILNEVKDLARFFGCASE